MACLLALVLAISLLPTVGNAATNDVLGIENGKIYYIKNVFTNHYLDVYAADDTFGTSVNAVAFNGNQNQQWKAVRNSDGTYTFVAVFSPTGKVMEASSINQLEINLNSGKATQKFTVTRDSVGHYRLKNNGKYATVTAPNSRVTMQPTDPYTTSAWSFISVVKGSADICAFYYSGYDSRGSVETFQLKMNGMGYSNGNLLNRTAQTAFGLLKSDDIWVFHGYGSTSAGYLRFYDPYGVITDWIVAKNGSSLNGPTIESLAANALACERCVLYMGCRATTSNPDYDLANKTFDKGAHFVLGAKIEPTVSADDKWIKKFFDTAATGARIDACITAADNATGRESYYRGDIAAKLKP